MVPFLKALFSIRYLALAVLATIVWQGYNRYGPEMPQISEIRRALADQVVEAIVSGLPNVPGIRRAYVFKFADDDSEYFTDRLRERIVQANRFTLIPKGMIDKIKEDLRLPENAVSTLPDALRSGRELEVDGVIFGRIVRFAETGSGADLSVMLRLADVGQGRVVFMNEFKGHLAAEAIAMDQYRRNLQASPLAARMLYWFLFAALLPIPTLPFIRMVLRRESNVGNLLLLGGYTLLSFVCALALTGFTVGGYLTAGFLIGVLVLSIGYYTWFFACVLRLSREF